MALGDDRVTFWFGCNMLRHAEMIRLSIRLMERVGYDVNAVGGPAYLPADGHDHEPRAASTMAARTVDRSTRAPQTTARQSDHLVPFVPHAYVRHHGARQRAHFDIAHLSEILSDRADQLASAMSVP